MSSVNLTKQQIEAAEDRWNVFASAAGWRCASCGCVPPYGERSTYFLAKTCGPCADQAQQNPPAQPDSGTAFETRAG